MLNISALPLGKWQLSDMPGNRLRNAAMPVQRAEIAWAKVGGGVAGWPAMMNIWYPRPEPETEPSGRHVENQVWLDTAAGGVPDDEARGRLTGLEPSRRVGREATGRPLLELRAYADRVVLCTLPAMVTRVSLTFLTL